MKQIQGSELQVGDDLVFLGKPHRITHFVPYDPAKAGLPAEDGWRFAHDGLNWAMTIDPNGHYETLGP